MWQRLNWKNPTFLNRSCFLSFLLLSWLERLKLRWYHDDDDCSASFQLPVNLSSQPIPHFLSFFRSSSPSFTSAPIARFSFGLWLIQIFRTEGGWYNWNLMAGKISSADASCCGGDGPEFPDWTRWATALCEQTGKHEMKSQQNVWNLMIPTNCSFYTLFVWCLCFSNSTPTAFLIIFKFTYTSDVI